MMKRALFILFPFCTLAAMAAMATGGSLPEAWRNWQYSRPIALAPQAESGLVRVALPLAVHGQSQARLADLRVMDEEGREVPYVLHARLGRKTSEWRDVGFSEVGFVPGRYTGMVVDAGKGDALHNAVEIRTDKKDFMVWVEVAASDDAENWRIVRARAPIYRFEKDGLTGVQVVSYPETRSRRLRVRILEGEEQFPIHGFRVGLEVVEEAERNALPVSLELNAAGPSKESRWQADPGAAHVPVSAVWVAATQPEFHRAARVSVSEDGKSWRHVGRGAFYRYRESHRDEPRSSLHLEFPEVRGRHWRVTVFNRNDPPIEGLRVELGGTPRYVVFRADAGQSYHLLYGNSRTAAPEYELARLTPREDLETAPTGSLGEAEGNSAYISPEPWSERHSFVLWIGLGLAVVVLGGLALRSLRTQQQ